MPKQKGTQTSDFGSPGRVSHDSSHFYASRLYQGQVSEDYKTPYQENQLPEEVRNRVLQASSTNMHHLPDCSVHLMVTSPPYNARKSYDQDLTLDEYLALLEKVLGETYRVLVPGGRACVNIANLGRKPYIPLNSFITRLMLEIGFLMRGEIIWDKAASGGSSTAWGSWLAATNPTLRDVHEYILVFSKGRFKRNASGRHSTIERAQFLEYTKSVWTFPTESAKKIGHPAPFPVELPFRLIHLYTFAGEVILDPFMGSGQTGIAARRAGRDFVGYEIEAEYAQLANLRIQEEEAALENLGDNLPASSQKTG